MVSNPCPEKDSPGLSPGNRKTGDLKSIRGVRKFGASHSVSRKIHRCTLLSVFCGIFLCSQLGLNGSQKVYPSEGTFWFYTSTKLRHSILSTKSATEQVVNASPVFSSSRPSSGYRLGRQPRDDHMFKSYCECFLSFGLGCCFFASRLQTFSSHDSLSDFVLDIFFSKELL